MSGKDPGVADRSIERFRVRGQRWIGWEANSLSFFKRVPHRNPTWQV